MSQDLLSLYNLALSATGHTILLSSTAENGPEAEQCRLWYPVVRDSVMRMARWSANKAARRLSLDAERDDSENWVATDPLPGWRYSYVAPEDMLYPRYLSDFSNFTMYVKDSRWTVQSNVETPILIYSKKLEDVSLFDSELFFSIAYMLASHISLPLHGKLTRTRLAFEQGTSMILNARVSSANEESIELEHIPEGFRARGYNSQQTSRFYYPLGKMYTSTEVGLG
jgi:hypothetical protein